VELNYSGLHKAHFTKITHRIVAKDHQHTRETKEYPYQAPKAHTLRTGTFAKPSFITLVVSRSKTIQAKRPGTSQNKQMEHAFSFGILDYLSRNPVFLWKLPFGKKKIVFPFTFRPKFPDFLGEW